ncbi:MAG: polysaccharide biosynthesis protein [Treponema sp.]|nr:polysaccharide biosynthesis protein [Treponema sp.]
MGIKKRIKGVRWTLVIYDLLIMLAAAFVVFQLMHGAQGMNIRGLVINLCLFCACIFTSRFIGDVYRQIWRYGGTQGYVLIIGTEAIGFVVYFLISRFTPVENYAVIRMTAFVSLDLLGVLTTRMMYRYSFKRANTKTAWGRFLYVLLKVFGNIKPSTTINEVRKINVAILGAGNIGVNLVQELAGNKNSMYQPVCFIDVNQKKIGRYIHGLKVFDEKDNLGGIIQDYNIQEIIFAVSDMSDKKKKELYELFTKAGCRIMVYDAPQIDDETGKSHLREFNVEDLLFRRQQFVVDEKTKAYYKDKVILITGGGGSIGSELCRQIAEMNPKELIILDNYENGAYDIQQELRIKYHGNLKVAVEICSITNMEALEKVFSIYNPQIVINAAAHKHVPLMEHNVIEAIENNVFGCKNVIDCCEKYGAERFIMVSTDKAVNPTNVMGTTKRVCEMIAQSASTTGNVKYSSTRFGNVLGSAGSVIPLFKRQIEQGGPVTITDKRIIRYFMTIPEASQLVLASGAMAKNGDLFVLDMGKPVKILDLAESMIRLMGAQNIEIIETGLRPGEKLYEELLIQSEKLEKTENSQIFIEHDEALTEAQIEELLTALRKSCESGDNNVAREALRSVVPTFRKPEDVNERVGK